MSRSPASGNFAGCGTGGRACHFPSDPHFSIASADSGGHGAR